MNTPSVIQSLWIGKELSVMERLSISSFLKNGHPFHLYVYDDVSGIPEGVTILDASKILSPDRIFKYKNHNSYAGFSNLFRYKLLLEKGAYWVDTDVVCLKEFLHNEEYVFTAERMPSRFFRNKLKFGSCIIKVPKDSAIMDYCYKESAKKDSNRLFWGQTGPHLLTRAIKKYKMKSFVADPEVFCPINWWDLNQLISESPGINALKGSQAVHLWNEMWRRNNIDKSAQFDKNSIYEKLKKAYLYK